MGIAGFNLKDIVKRISYDIDKVSLSQGALFIVPPLVITLTSYALFALLTDITGQQLNVFSIIVMSAIILSLVGTGGMQILVYRIIEDNRYHEDRIVSRY